MPIERMFETRRISVNRGSTQVLVKVVLFQFRGRDHPQGDPTSRFFPNSQGFLLGLSNEVSFVSGFFREIGQKESKCFPENKGYGITCPPVQCKIGCL